MKSDDDRDSFLFFQRLSSVQFATPRGRGYSGILLTVRAADEDKVYFAS